MIVTASKVSCVVQYKETGKIYDRGNDTDLPIPFDEKVLAPGESFDVPGELIAVREYTGTAELNLDPSGGHGNGDSGS